ncbi:RNA-binding S4 domain-containing protein [Parerythrobacter aestuarii]|uniref:RNA-binding S4 domain-containing protein n=1 Tax=Parerythrobacter aestuarii TaxID=3020909 RepID=UPI0024DEBBBF|nr:S4 domain-containing protein [Parerythrobacter aestuarii]
MRLDLALTRLRFTKTRSTARALVEAGHLRVNGQRVTQSSRSISVGDVLTLPRGKSVAVVQLLTLPERRGPPAEAQSCYRTLDPTGETAIAKDNSQDIKGNLSP